MLESVSAMWGTANYLRVHRRHGRLLRHIYQLQEFLQIYRSPTMVYDGKELSVEYTQSTQLYYLYYCYNEGSNNDMFRPHMWTIFRL